jgi:hypothetical protein
LNVHHCDSDVVVATHSGSQERNCVPVNIVKRIKSIELETRSNWTAIHFRAIASSDLPNLVHLSDHPIVPVVTVNRASPRDRGAGN